MARSKHGKPNGGSPIRQVLRVDSLPVARNQVARLSQNVRPGGFVRAQTACRPNVAGALQQAVPPALSAPVTAAPTGTRPVTRRHCLCLWRSDKTGISNAYFASVDSFEPCVKQRLLPIDCQTATIALKTETQYSASLSIGNTR